MRPIIVQSLPNTDDPNFLGPSPKRYLCPYCEKTVITRTKSRPTGVTHCVAAVLCLSICCICYFWVPYAIKFQYVTKHYCPLCKRLLGEFRLFGHELSAQVRQ